MAGFQGAWRWWQDLIKRIVPVLPFTIREWETAPDERYVTPGKNEPPEMPVAAKNAFLLLIRFLTVKISLISVP